MPLSISFKKIIVDYSQMFVYTIQYHTRGEENKYMNIHQKQYITLMADLFHNSFVSAIRRMPQIRQSEFAHNIRLFFNKWFYSSFVDGSLLSPANLLLANADENEPMLYPDFYTNAKGEIVHTLIKYSIKTHPFVKDIHFFADCFNERRDFINDPFFKSDEFFNGISIPDSEYAFFLRTAAVRIGLLNKMPSINADVLLKSDSFDKILKSDNKTVLLAAVEAVICDCADRLNKIVDSDDAIYDKLHSFLKRPLCVIDEIQDIFSGFCEDMMDTLDIETLTEQPGEFIQELIESGTKSIAYETTLDKYFFTPLSCYLRLLQPIYLERMRLIPLFSEYTRRMELESPIPTDNLVYYLCWGYSFTPLGMQLFENKDAVEQASIDGDEVLLPKDISPVPIFEALSRAFYPEYKDANIQFNIKSAVSSKLLTEMLEAKNASVFGFYINCDKVMRETLYVEVSGSSPVDIMHEHICTFIGVDPNLEYTLTIGKTATPFNTYSYDNEVELLNTANVIFDKLPIDVHTIVHYTIYGIGIVKDGFVPENQHGISFTISGAKKMPALYGRVYPWQKLLENDFNTLC